MPHRPGSRGAALDPKGRIFGPQRSADDVQEMVRLTASGTSLGPHASSDDVQTVVLSRRERDPLGCRPSPLRSRLIPPLPSSSTLLSSVGDARGEAAGWGGAQAAPRSLQKPVSTTGTPCALWPPQSPEDPSIPAAAQGGSSAGPRAPRVARRASRYAGPKCGMTGILKFSQAGVWLASASGWFQR
jgi:hypothetical protein